MHPNDDPQRLAKQFTKSLQRWGGTAALCEDDLSHLVAPLNKHILAAIAPDRCPRNIEKAGRKEEWKQVAHLSHSFLNAYLVQQFDYLSGHHGYFVSLLSATESPIEALMLLSLIICARDNGLGVSAVWRWDHKGKRFDEQLDLSIGVSRVTVEISPQSNVGQHRVDFLLSFFGTDLVRVPDSKSEWKEVRVDNKIIVECDGHDFHEKTKEQARRDKERDRNLQSLGFPVYRYTGSEVYADVFSGAAEVIRALTRRDIPGELRKL